MHLLKQLKLLFSFKSSCSFSSIVLFDSSFSFSSCTITCLSPPFSSNPLNLLLLLFFLNPQLPNSITKVTQQNPLILGGLTINPHIIAAIPGLLHSNSTANQKINRRMDQIQGKNLKKCLPILKDIYSTSGLGCCPSMISSKAPSYCNDTSPSRSCDTDLLGMAPHPQPLHLPAFSSSRR